MVQNIIAKIFSNGFCLIIPVLLLNILLVDKLPAPFNTKKFDQGISNYILIAENIMRMIVFLLPLLINLQLKNPVQKLGVSVYIVGLVLYITSWMLLIYLPESSWGTGVIGFTAPAYTPLIWLTGIGLMSGETYLIGIIYRPWFYIIISIVFVAIHFYHTYLAYISFYNK